jgi:hypothetical protein
MFFLFQDPQQLIEASKPLFDYGILGIFSVLMLLLIYFLGRQFIRLHQKNLDRINMLEGRLVEYSAKMEKYLSEDRAIIMDMLKNAQHTIENNNNALAETRKVVAENTRIFQEIAKSR